MNKCYYRIVWENYPSEKTPLNEQNLNKIDSAADEMDNRIISLDSTKFDKSEAQLLVKYIEYNESTGIFKITHYNGASYTIDTLLEKLAINFDYDYRTQKLIIELSDGTVKYVDLSALITQYEFLESETVTFTVDSFGKISAKVKEGSIEEKHLRPNYLADIKVEVAKAEASANDADESARAAVASAAAAKSSETAAAASEAAAATSAQGAADSAATASEKAAAAEKSAGDSSSFAANAKESETNAKASEKSAAASKESAAISATSAGSSATVADEKSRESQGYANISKSYAVGTDGEVRENDNFDCAEYYYEQSKRISQSFTGIVPMGTINFEDLDNFDNQQSGYMFNISDSFTSDDRFKDGGGIFYGAGSNVLYTADGKWDVLAASMVTGVKGNAEKEYRQGFINLTPANIGALSLTGDAKNNIVSFTSADEDEPTAWTDFALFKSKEKFSSYLNKVSVMARNLRYFLKMLGDGDISSIGDGTVTGAIRLLNMGLDNLSDKLCDASNDVPNSGYDIHQGAYIRRNPFGHVDIFFTIDAYVPKSTLHTIAFTPYGYRPSPYAALSCFAVVDSGLDNKQLECYAYANGDIRVVSALDSGVYRLGVWGSYFVNQ